MRATVEVAHEALIRRWSTLRAWVDANRDNLRARTAILQAKKEWEEKGKNEQYLIDPGVRLERGRGLLANAGDVPVDDIRDYADLSIAKDERRLKAIEDEKLAAEGRIAEAERQAREAAEEAARQAGARAAAEEQARQTAEKAAEERERQLKRAQKALARIALDAQGGFAWDARRPPFPGLRAFQEENAAVYLGRDDDIRRLIERLEARRAQGGAKLIALLGSLGSGKSSLLRAGVIPRLKRAGRNWIVVPPMRPHIQPIDELARALARARSPPFDWAKLRDNLLGRDPARALDDSAGHLRVEARATEAQILIPIDQAEKLFGVADPDEAKRFLEILSRALSESLPFMAVMALRSDFLGQLQSAASLTVREILAPPHAARPRAADHRGSGAGSRPQRRRRVRAAGRPRCGDRGCAAVAGLYAARTSWLAIKQSSDAGALQGAWRRDGRAEPARKRRAQSGRESARRGHPEELTALREALVPAMVRVNERGEYVRRPARMDALPAKAHPLLERLAEERLIMIRQEGDARVVEVAHEALLRKWPWLKQRLDAERVFLIGKQQLEQDLRDWEAAPAKDKADALLTGLKLSRVSGWLIDRPAQLTAQERALIQASIERVGAENAAWKGCAGTLPGARSPRRSF
jgi:hypothetical protein